MNVVRVIAVTLLLGTCAPCLADELTAQKKADIEKLLEVTGSTGLAKQMGVAAVAQIGQVIRKMRPDIPQRVNAS